MSLLEIIAVAFAILMLGKIIMVIVLKPDSLLKMSEAILRKKILVWLIILIWLAFVCWVFWLAFA